MCVGERAGPSPFLSTGAGIVDNSSPRRPDFAIAAGRKPRELAAVKLHLLPAGPILTNAYLLTDAPRGEAVLIDAPAGVWADVKPVLVNEQCRLAELWITHGHWDHMQGAAEVQQASGATVRAHPDDRAMLEEPDGMRRFTEERLMINLGRIEAVRVDHWLKHGERFSALGTDVEVRHTPGHCPGNVLFYLPLLKAAFVGDTLFNGATGRTDLPGGSFEVLERSIRQQIYTLPPETTVFPGHGPETTVGQERIGNPYVKA